jgi:hypothetical protein
MSAFVVQNMHIDAIISYAVDKRISYYSAQRQTRIEIGAHNAEEIGRILMDENVRSVCARYPDIENDVKDAASEYAYKGFSTPLTAIEIIKACNCLEYQSCETSDWDASLAWRILHDIKAHAVHHLPGYNNAPWEVTPESAKTLQHAGQISLMSLVKRR